MERMASTLTNCKYYIRDRGMYLERKHISCIHNGNLLDTRGGMYILICSWKFWSQKGIKIS